MKVLLIFMFSGITLHGCAKPFQPAPYDFQRWSRDGESKEEIQEAMIDCGFSNYLNNGKMNINDYAKAQNCMIKKGYMNDYERGVFCDRPIYQKLPACH